MTTPIAAGVPSALYQSVNADIDHTFTLAMMSAKKQATFIQSRKISSPDVNLAMALQTPTVGRWGDQKHAQSVQTLLLTLPLFPLEGTIEIDKYRFNGDVLGLVQDSVISLGAQAGKYSDKTWAIMAQSGYATSYAGYWKGNGRDDYGPQYAITDAANTYLFSTNHKFGDFPGATAQSNIVTGSLSSPQTWGTAINALRGFKGDRGQPLQGQPLGVVFGPNDEYAVLNAIKASMNAIDQRPSITSVNALPAVPITNNLATSLYGLELYRLDWLQNDPGVSYLIGETNGIGSSFEYWLEALHMQPHVDPNSETVFNNRKFQWSVEGYGRVLIPNWFNIIRVVDPTIATYV